RYATHDSGTLWIAGPSMVGDFHPLISTGLPAHTVFISSIFYWQKLSRRVELNTCRSTLLQVLIDE
ncbi:hypothetical protein, partial [Klebsiella michiganensis]